MNEAETRAEHIDPALEAATLAELIFGRGARLYDGKDYFAIIDFVKAHHHFSDLEWDGEPIGPESKRHSQKVSILGL